MSGELSKDIDHAFSAMKEVFGQECLDALFHPEDPGDGKRLWEYYALVVCLLDTIKDGRLKRWDFDIFPGQHRDRRKTEIQSRWKPPYSLDQKMRVLEAIIWIFRRYCQDDITEIVVLFENCRNHHELEQTKGLAMKKGILIEDKDRLQHNPSWPDSKRVFSAYVKVSRHFSY